MGTIQPIRQDALPEHANYTDTGCNYHPRCLNCPFPVCRYDNPDFKRQERASSQREQVLAAKRSGQTAAEIANALGISTRTVYRIKA
jgi:DNA-binding NarL/FixJ family response regulator